MITFDHVTKRYADGTVALDDFTLECPTGEITVFVGTSGGGKTTALRTINRMVDPTSGRVLIDGQDIKEKSPAELRRGIGYVIQQVGLFPHRTIRDNIATVPYLLGWDKAKARTTAMELMQRVGLPASMAKRYPFQLSGGQQQRVGVARALAADPPVMLMDEPFSAVDPVVRAELQQEFLRLQSELHKTIVFVTHDVDEAIRLGDHIAVFRTGGELVQHATPADLLANPADDFVASFIGRDRGIRLLSFHTADDIALHDSAVVPASATRTDARAALAGVDGEPWLLIVDDARRPVGWLSAESADAVPESGTLGDAGLLPIGNTFQVGVDPLRSALDSSVLSPSGRAVGVDADGAVLGVATQADLAAAIRAVAAGDLHPHALDRAGEPDEPEPAGGA
ncbi:MAG TPA: ATP-binding cassette domain-containing protein [Streptosporangiaceae bacterium]